MSHAEILGKAISNITSDSWALSPVLSPQVQHSADIVGVDQGQGGDDTCLDTWVPAAGTCAVSLHVATEAWRGDEDVLRVSADVTITGHVNVTLAGAPGPGNRNDNVVEMGTSWKYVQSEILVWQRLK